MFSHFSCKKGRRPQKKNVTLGLKMAPGRQIKSVASSVSPAEDFLVQSHDVNPRNTATGHPADH